MSWLATLMDALLVDASAINMSLTDISEFWFDWQVRAVFFSAFILWLALGTGLRSPITRCAILIIGSWLLLAFPLLQLWLPRVELPILPFVLSSTASSSYLLMALFFFACVISSLLLIRFAVSFIGLIQLHRSCEPIKSCVDVEQAKLIEGVFDNCLANVYGGESDRTKAGTAIELCFSPLAKTPLTYGVPVSLGVANIGKSHILLPISAAEWSESRLMICLTHELWHIKRRDWVSQQIVCLMQLFLVLNPIARRLQKGVIDGMESCVDKLCVQSGIDSQEYAAALLEQTRETGSTKSLFAPTFFGEHRYGSSSLQQRIGGLTGEPFGWSSMRPSVSCLIAVLLVLSAFAFSMLTPIKWASTSLENAYTPIYVSPSYSALLESERLSKREAAERGLAEVDSWPSLQAPVINRLKEAYVDLSSDYQAEPVFANISSETLGHISSDSHIVVDAMADSLKRIELSRMSIGDIDVPGTPNASYLAVPTYPMREELRNREGWVELAFDLDASGIPIDPRIIDSSGSTRFERVAIQAIQESRYSMQTRSGVSLITEGLTQSYFFQMADPKSQRQPQPSDVEQPPP